MLKSKENPLSTNVQSLCTIGRLTWLHPIGGDIEMPRSILSSSVHPSGWCAHSIHFRVSITVAQRRCEKRRMRRSLESSSSDTSHIHFAIHLTRHPGSRSRRTWCHWTPHGSRAEW